MSGCWINSGRLWRKITAVLIGILIFAGTLNVSATGLKNSDVTDEPGKLIADVTHASEGFFTAGCEPGSRRMKLRVSFGEDLVTYDLNKAGKAEVFPLQFGSGNYTVTLYENVGGKMYLPVGEVSFSVSMEDEQAAFLRPNQFVNYSDDSPAVQMGCKACEGLETETDKFEAIKALMKKNFTYDYILAATVKSGALPDIDSCCEKHMGICQDLAATAVCMLRTQGIYSKLVMGYADVSYHAWIVAYVDGEEVLYDPTFELHVIKQPEVYTAERCY